MFDDFERTRSMLVDLQNQVDGTDDDFSRAVIDNDLNAAESLLSSLRNAVYTLDELITDLESILPNPDESDESDESLVPADDAGWSS